MKFAKMSKFIFVHLSKINIEELEFSMTTIYGAVPPHKIQNICEVDYYYDWNLTKY